MKSTTATKKSATTASVPNPVPASCGCETVPGADPSCADPICFQRPNYFCGQLLTDMDLSSEQTYVREKLKLYHRTLHGHGIVCGLRLTCDPDCCGNVLIGEGFAIDNCGNDVIVCQPLRFDVIAALKAKGWLVTDSGCDPCKGEEPPPCKVKQCFYVTICYDEEPSDFTTPFKTNCGPGAAACEPTRIRETVRFDVLQEPPACESWLDELEERITCCWDVFTKGPFAMKLKEIIGKREKTSLLEMQSDECCGLFCELKVLFQHHLQRSPPLYDCQLWDRLCHLNCQKDDEEGCRDALCGLFKLIQEYVYECILGEMIFQCPRPPSACCIGLGTVEVEDGKLQRVCNCPRSYVWTFSNFFQVLIANIVGGRACQTENTKHYGERESNDRQSSPCDEEKREHCCAHFEFECEQFLRLFSRRPDFGTLAAAAPLKAIRQIFESLKQGFDFTYPTSFSPEIFKGMSKKDAETLAAELAPGIRGESLTFEDQPEHYETPDPIRALLSRLLRKPGDPLVAVIKDGIVADVIPPSQLPVPNASRTELEGFGDRIKALEKKLDALTKDTRSRPDKGDTK